MRNESGFTVNELIFAIFGLLSVALVVGGIWVAIHFIAKWW